MTSGPQSGEAGAGSSPQDAPSATDAALINPRRLTQVLAGLAIGLSFGIFWYMGKWLGVPPELRHQGSLLQQPWGIARVVFAWVLVVLCTVLGNTILGPRWFLGGLFAATAGLIAWSIRGGPMRFVLFAAASPAIYLELLVELLLLFLVVGALWIAFWEWYEGHRPLSDPPQEEPVGGTGSDGPAALAVVAQVLTIAVLVFVMGATDNKKQSILAVGLAAFAGTSLACHFTPSRRAGAWYWIGPLAVGALGYLGAYAQPEGWVLGDTNGPLAALARPLPLDYASAGTFGALLGYWAGSDDPSIGASIVFSVFAGHVVKPRRLKKLFPPKPNDAPPTTGSSKADKA